MEKPKLITCICVSITGAALNIALSSFLWDTVPLYLDTVFTMAVTFYGGLFAGILTGALTNLFLQSIFFYGWAYYLYAFCNIAVALVTYLFIRWFPRELDVSIARKHTRNSEQLRYVIECSIILILLSFALTIVISVLGGIFATLINAIEKHTILSSAAYDTSEIIAPELNFKLALIRKGFPHILTEIGSRIPVNILDRLLSSFVGFWIVFGLWRLGKKNAA